ncbi:hypothetical protein GGI04_002868 [Coemansia thaxteri]|uniref:Uncharacterized protein n=1 Tax=Coemansia thaxteri TaxID=2663907 RepID=A0A9W8BP36_9FUNG|nr:hypothetical protein GGI04_002868 [Coemansia thaxteri]KAJ2008248.1 hypothetical protein H4R26_000282 [Coemansia thaxteri]KAJ2470674.1 hypothetical protein GGI02_002776 [Coemansia sp. RSA 2322]KAJ2485283.1 hypothetical protein EV174_001833 [Coemansia sp. RSA 2320]
MDFLRRRLGRSAQQQHVDTAQAVDKAKRRGYFNVRTTSTPLLREPEAAALAGGNGAPRMQRRRSIPGVAYLMAARLSAVAPKDVDGVACAAVLAHAVRSTSKAVAARRGSDSSSSSSEDSDDTLAGADAPQPAALPADTAPAEARAQRRQLRLSRWRMSGAGFGGDAGTSRPPLDVRPARLSLSLGLGERRRAAHKDELAHGGIAAPTAHKVTPAHESIPADKDASARGDTNAPRPRRSSALGRLMLAPPPPSAAEQARLDAWAADGDEFSARDYDLTGLCFELAPPPPPVADAGAGAGAALCRRVFAASARKLQRPHACRGMASVVLIRATMVKASAHYAAASGGRRLDAPRVARDALCELGAATRAVVRVPGAAVEAPLSSPPPRSPSAEIADAALAECAALPDFGAGDLVPLAASAPGSDAPAYRRQRRRRSGRHAAPAAR